MKRLFLCLAALILILVALLPTILSTPFGVRLLMRCQDKESLPGDLQIGALSLSWFGTQEITALSYVEKTSNLSFTTDKISSTAPLWKLLLVKLRAGPVKIPYFASALIEGGKLTFSPPGITSLTVSGLHFDGTISPSSDQILFHLSGDTVQDQAVGHFELSGDLSKLKSATPLVELDSTLSNLPVSGLDQLAGHFNKEFSGVLLSSIGPCLNLDFKAKASENEASLLLNAKSDKFTAHLEALSKGGVTTLSSPGFLSLTLPPALVNRWLGQAELKNQPSAEIRLTSLSLPSLKEGMQGVAFEGTLTLSKAELNLSEQALVIDQLKGSFSSADAAASIPWQLSCNLSSESAAPLIGKNVQLTLSGEVKPEMLFFSVAASSSQFKMERADFVYAKGLNLNSPLVATLSPLIDGLTLPQLKLSIDKLSIPPSFEKMNMEAEISSSQVSKAPYLDLKDFKCLVRMESWQKIALDVKESNFQFTTTASLKKGGELLSFDAPLSGQWLLTNAQLQRFFASQTEAPVLSNPTPINFEIKPFALPLKGLDINTLQIDALASLDIMSVRRASSSNDAGLRNLTAKLHFTGKDEKISATLSSDMFEASNKAGQIDLNFEMAQKNITAKAQIKALSTSSLETLLGVKNLAATAGETLDLNLDFKSKGDHFIAAVKGSGKHFDFSIDALAEHLFDDKGAFNLNDALLTLDVKANHLPAALLDTLTALATGECPFSALFGESLNAVAHVQVEKASGPIQLTLTSVHSRVSLNGHVQNGLLTLNDPFHAQVTMTPALSKLLLKRVNPLSLSSIKTDNPITIEIAKEGFSLPLNPFDISQMTIPKLEIELGRVTCENEGNISIAIGLLKSSDLANSKELNLWFAPINLEIKKGVVNFERTEILLADSLEIAIWGQIDLPANNVDMILGLTAQCLRKAFGIKNLPKDYVIQVPMRGKTDNVKINTSAATAKITALLLWQKKSLAGGAIGGAGGALFGQFMNMLGSLPDAGSKSPPAKHPFPWEENKEKTSSSSYHKKGIKPGDKPLKQILKVLR